MFEVECQKYFWPKNGQRSLAVFQLSPSEPSGMPHPRTYTLDGPFLGRNFAPTTTRRSGNTR